ncbi:MAG: hypothetical protein PHN98_04645 [Smithellaceae bacterium]|jgi:hypothetical protein|nr:hypothetical protein [Smithellaceae bacterium]
MKNYLWIIVLIAALLIPAKGISSDKVNYTKIPPQNFFIEIYEDGKKIENRFLYVDLKILNRKDAQWTTLFLDGSRRCIKRHTAIYKPVVSRWDEAISDIHYDKNSFQLKLKFPHAEEEMTVKGKRIKNTSDFKIEGTGYRKDLVSNEKVTIEWKSIIVDAW